MLLRSLTASVPVAYSLKALRVHVHACKVKRGTGQFIFETRSGLADSFVFNKLFFRFFNFQIVCYRHLRVKEGFWIEIYLFSLFYKK